MVTWNNSVLEGHARKKKKDWECRQLYSVSEDDCSSPASNAYGHPLRGWPLRGFPHVPHVRGVLLGGGAEDCDCCSFCKLACSSPKKTLWSVSLWKNDYPYYTDTCIQLLTDLHVITRTTYQKEITLSLLFSFPFGALWLHLCSVFQEIACLMVWELFHCIGP